MLKLKEHSDEQKERTETAEFQISTISQEYRKLVENRDAEIRRLKRDKKLQEETTYHNADPHSPLKELARLQLGDSNAVSHHDGTGSGYESVDIGMMGGEWVEQEDFSDVISSQAEINRLRSELSQLRMELHYLKTVAKDEVRICVCMFHPFMRCVHVRILK